MSVNFKNIAPVFAVCMGAGSVIMNYGSYYQNLKNLQITVEAQEKKVNTIDIMANDIIHIQGSVDELKLDIKNDFAELKNELRDIKQRMR